MAFETNNDSGDCIKAAFEAQVRRTPEAPAVYCGEATLSYAQLNARANACAALLRARGLGRGSYVGLGFERSVDMLVALWGVVKAGAAYIPVDPAYPEARIAHMASAARWSALLAGPALLEKYQAAAGSAPILSLPATDGQLQHPDPVSNAGPDDPLYAIFTSGSTGQPKAATVFRSGFANLLQWYEATFSITAATRALVMTSLSFDLTQKNLFAPLLAGGAVVLQPPGPYDLVALTCQITHHNVSLLNTTPSAFYPLVDATASRGYADLSSLRAVVLGGEPISVPRLQAWLQAPATQAFVANTYGPTECTDICAWHRLDRTNLHDWPFVPLGREIPRVGIVLLNEHLQPVPVGEQGELCITGAGVGGGYLHDPARTADRFVPNPCPSVVPGSVLYRTGDLARRDENGVLEFRGRMDHQVKVRGFRIELGEIELALTGHPAVREAVVTASHAGDEDARLTAWLLPVGTPADLADVRAYLAARLPAYMVPQQFQWLDAYPMTPNAKVDRLALQQRTPAADAGAPVAAPAGNGWESRLLALWSEVLARPVEDPTANFFDLGGNSLQLAVLHTRLCEWTGRALPITDLFAHTTVRALAHHLADPGHAHNQRAVLDRARRQQAGFAHLRRTPTS